MIDIGSYEFNKEFEYKGMNFVFSIEDNNGSEVLKLYSPDVDKHCGCVPGELPFDQYFQPMVKPLLEAKYGHRNIPEG